MTHGIPIPPNHEIRMATSSPPRGPFRSDLIDRLRQLFESMLAYCCPLMFLRLDVRFPANGCYPNDNSLFTNFLESYRRYVQRHWGDCGYVWVRERNPETPHHHYHIALLVTAPPGLKKKHLFELADRLWSLNLGLDPGIPNGLVDHCDRPCPDFPTGNGATIDRSDAAWVSKVEECYGRSVYLAKLHSKECLPASIRSTGSSRMPRTDAL